MAKVEMLPERVVAGAYRTDSMEGQVSPEEWALRQELAALYRGGDPWLGRSHLHSFFRAGAGRG